MSWLGAKKPTPRETAREAKRDLKRSERELQREVAGLERQEKQLIAEIKREAAKSGGGRATRAMAKQLVALRATKDRLAIAKVQVGSAAMQTQLMASQATLGATLGQTAGVMAQMNANAATTTKAMQDFVRQQEMSNVREELVNDALADAFDEPGAEEEADSLVSQVLAEVGFQATDGLAAAPVGRPVGAAAEAAPPQMSEAELDAELQRMLAGIPAAGGS